MSAPKMFMLLTLFVFYTSASGQSLLASCPPKRCFTAQDCPYGYVYDANGCQTCQCYDPPQPPSCPPLRCSERVRCLYGYQMDGRGCRTCNCASKCPMRECFQDLECTSGFRTNSEGCNICECNPSFRSAVKDDDCPVRFCKFCENGYVLDDKGCQTCQCRDEPVMCPAPYCTEECQHGYELDDKGCQTCRCKIGPPRACPPMCGAGLLCRPDTLKVINGCPQCDCELKPVFQQLVPAQPCTQDSDCTDGRCHTTDLRLVPNFRCVHRNLINDGLCGFAMECPPSTNRGPRCVSMNRTATCLPACTENCGSMFRQCEHGLEMDNQGCSVCRCRAQSPCGSCGPQERCEFFGYNSQQVRTCEAESFTDPCATVSCTIGRCVVLAGNAFCMAPACQSRGPRCRPCPDGSMPTRTTDPVTGCPGQCSPCTQTQPLTPTCDNFPCPSGQRCQMVFEQCDNPPCALRPTCVPNCPPEPTNCDPSCRAVESNGCRVCVCPAVQQATCASTTCPAGQRCVMKAVQCVRAPCPEQPICEPPPQVQSQPACPQINCADCGLGSFLFREEDTNGCPTKCNCVSFYDLCHPGRCQGGTDCIVQSSYCRPGGKCPPPEVVCVDNLK